MDYKRLPFYLKSVEGRTVKGYAATWQEDQGGDTIVKGAFAKTLLERGPRVKVLRDHWAPIGKPILMKGDDAGLYVEYPISETPLGNETLTLIGDGVLDTMSIGYEAVRVEKSGEFPDKRKLIEIKLYEFSVVTFAMNEGAIITGVKSMREAIRHHAVSDGERKDLIEALKEFTALLSAATPAPATSHRHDAKQLVALSTAIGNYKASFAL